MKKIPLKEFFEYSLYDWKADVPLMEDICSLSKSRLKEDPPDKFTLNWGMEQPFFIKAFLESIGSKQDPINYFEIGTGRGTSCMAAASCENVDKIDSFDILIPKEKRNNVINHREVQASNVDILKKFKELYSDKIARASREESTMNIKLRHVSEYSSFIDSEENRDYDVCFIDGEHDNPEIILKDYLICNKIMERSDQAYIIWDDYYPDKMAVKEVVDKIIEVDKRECYLVPFRGHLFQSENREPETESGEVVMKLK
jgi:hypothetical protein